MFNLISNVKNRNVIGNISLPELVSFLKNPSIVHKKFVDEARSLDKKSDEYINIKQNLPCFVPNYTHKKYIKVNTIEKSTGFIYIDVDYKLDLDFSQFSFIASSWKSLSGVGSGLLIALDNSVNMGTSLKSMRTIINDICSTLDIKPDNCAVSRDRLNVLGYDYNVYYNENYTKYSIDLLVNKDTIKVDKKENKYINNRLACDVHFYDGDLRLSNIEDYTKDLVFEDDQLYIDMSENPIEFTEIYIPKSIAIGQRNSKMFKIISTIKALNPSITRERLIGFTKYINNNRCFEPMDNLELLKICNRVFETDIKLFPNKFKKYPFNPVYTLTGRERTNIATSVTRQKEAKKTTDYLLEMVECWNTKVDGKLTMKSLAFKSGKSYKTVLRRKSIKDLVSIK